MMKREPRKIAELEQFYQDEWKNITVEECTTLVKNYNTIEKNLTNKGHTIDYLTMRANNFASCPY